jgi:hypothetical protein
MPMVRHVCESCGANLGWVSIPSYGLDLAAHDRHVQKDPDCWNCNPHYNDKCINCGAERINADGKCLRCGTVHIGAVHMLPDLKPHEHPVSCAGTTRHHVNSLPVSVINELEKRGYELHDGQYYYVKDSKMDDVLKYCIEKEIGIKC